MNARIIAYWTATMLVAFVLVSGALGELNQQWGTLETVTILGYPAYVMTLIGVWKLAGAAALLVPRFPRLKEWAYAGIFFNMTGALISHAAVGDYGAYGFHLIATGSIALVALISWGLRPRARMLGEPEVRLTRATATAAQQA